MSKKSLKFKGTVQLGIFVPNESKAWHDYVKEFEGEEVWGSVAKFKPYQMRSNEQNRYYWGVVVKILSDELGYMPEEMHEVLKLHFLGKKETKQNKKGEDVILMRSGSTASLSTAEFESLMAKIRQWASIKFEIYIPEPNEVSFEY